MIIFAVTALLSLQDPAGDASGNGSLQLPTATVYRTAGELDVTQFELYRTPKLSFSLRFDTLNNPHNLKNGFSLPIIEIYFEDDVVPGSKLLLPGSGMQLPSGEHWNYALQLTGDTARVFKTTSDNSYEDVSSLHPLSLSVSGNTLNVTTNIPRPESLHIYGLVGNYATFSETGWQKLSATPSSWAYSSSDQVPPVIDVLATSREMQVQAINSATLPAIGSTVPFNIWPWVMVFGMVIALVGVFGRLNVRKPQPKPVLTPAPWPRRRYEPIVLADIRPVKEPQKLAVSRPIRKPLEAAPLLIDMRHLDPQQQSSALQGAGSSIPAATLAVDLPDLNLQKQHVTNSEADSEAESQPFALRETSEVAVDATAETNLLVHDLELVHDTEAVFDDAKLLETHSTVSHPLTTSDPTLLSGVKSASDPVAPADSVASSDTVETIVLKANPVKPERKEAALVETEVIQIYSLKTRTDEKRHGPETESVRTRSEKLESELEPFWDKLGDEDESLFWEKELKRLQPEVKGESKRN